jgi:hypothetical protein
MNKKILAGTTIALSLLVSGTALAASYGSPAEIVSGLTGKTTQQVYEQRATGKTYGQIASDSGKLADFQKEMLEYKKSIIEQRVKDGTMTKENGDAFLKELEQRIADCDGTPDPNRERLGQKYGGGIGFCGGQGQGQGQGQGMGFGRGRGAGNGMGFRYNTGK